MSRVLAIIFSTIFWCIGTAIILVFGPFLWIVILARSVLLYAVMMLLHAIANQELLATSRPLERAITWFPATLKNLFELLIESAKFDKAPQSLGTQNEPADETNFLSTLDEFLSWVIVELGPAILVWASVYFILKFAGYDLSVIFSEKYGISILILWVIFWGFAGLLTISMMSIVKLIVVAPFVFLIGVIWAFIGLLFWFPAMAWGIVEYTNLFFRYALSGGSMGDPSSRLEKAFRYYFSGFTIIGSVLTNPPSVSSVLGKELSLGQAWSKIKAPLRIRFFSLLLWPGLFLFLVWGGAMPFPL